MLGFDPYAYVEGNPETRTDPTGQKPVGCIPGSEGCSPGGAPAGGGGSNPCVLSGGNPQYCGPEGGGGQPSPGTGGGGSTGGCHSGSRDGASAMLCTGGQKPPPRKPTLTDPCAGNLICDAQSDANKASNYFWNLSGELAGIALSAQILAELVEALAALSLGSIWDSWMAPILSGIAAVLQTVSEAAGASALLTTVVAAEFGTQAANHTPDTWSRSYMANFKSEVDNTIIYGGIAMTVFLAARGLIRDIVAKMPGFILSNKVGAGIVRVLDASSGPLAAFGGGTTLQNEADSWIAQIDSDVAPAW